MSFLEKLKKGIKLKNPREETGEEEIKKTEREQKKEIKVKEENWFETEGELAVDVYQTNGEIIIEAPVAGVEVENLDIIIENDTIKIKGRRDKLQEIEEKKYLIKECYWGPFSREIILPVEVDGAHAEALMKKGILVIKVPKIEREKKRKIKIKEE